MGDPRTETRHGGDIAMSLPPWQMRYMEWAEAGHAVRAVERGPLKVGEGVVYRRRFLRSILAPQTSSLEPGGDTCLWDIGGTVIAVRVVSGQTLVTVEWDDGTTCTSSAKNLSRQEPPGGLGAAWHATIEQALKDGHPVPERVLAEVPDLAQQYHGRTYEWVSREREEEMAWRAAR